MEIEKQAKAQKELHQIHAELFSVDDNIVEKALVKVMTKGNDLSIRPLLELYVTTDNDKFKTIIQKLLYSLKTDNAGIHLIDALKGDDVYEHKPFILSIFWNAGIPCNAHILDLVQEAVDGDFEIAFEVLTILENSDNTFDQLSLEGAVIELDTYLQSHEEAETQYPIIFAIHEILSGQKETDF